MPVTINEFEVVPASQQSSQPAPSAPPPAANILTNPVAMQREIEKQVRRLNSRRLRVKVY